MNTGRPAGFPSPFPAQGVRPGLGNGGGCPTPPALNPVLCVLDTLEGMPNVGMLKDALPTTEQLKNFVLGRQFPPSRLRQLYKAIILEHRMRVPRWPSEDRPAGIFSSEAAISEFVEKLKASVKHGDTKVERQLDQRRDKKARRLAKVTRR